MVICWLQVLQKGGSVLVRRILVFVCDLRVSDSKSSYSYSFFSTYIVVWYFLVEMVCYVVDFGSICRSPNSVSFFSFSFGRWS